MKPGTRSKQEAMITAQSTPKHMRKAVREQQRRCQSCGTTMDFTACRHMGQGACKL